MSYVDVFYWGLLLVAFLGFAAALFILLAALVKPKSPDWKAKDLGVGKITKSPGKLKPKLQALIPGTPNSQRTGGTRHFTSRLAGGCGWLPRGWVRAAY